MATVLDPSPAGPTSPETLAKFEQYIGHPLPAEYRDFLLRFNGGHPDPDAFRLDTGFGEEENIVMCLFPMRDLSLGTVEANSLEALRSWPLHCAWDDLQHDLSGRT
jgi:hypothetical protein